MIRFFYMIGLKFNPPKSNTLLILFFLSNHDLTRVVGASISASRRAGITSGDFLFLLSSWFHFHLFPLSMSNHCIGG
jgi:hypothetical protein